MPSAIVTSRPTEELLEAEVTYGNKVIPIVFIPSDEGGYTVRARDLRGCISEGDTIEEALKNILDAIEVYFGDDDSPTK